MGYHINVGNKDDEIEKEFKKICEEEKITNIKFICEKKEEESFGQQISNFVNLNNGIDVDFVIMGHNPGRYPKLQDCPLAEVLNTCMANVVFLK